MYKAFSLQHLHSITECGLLLRLLHLFNIICFDIAIRGHCLHMCHTIGIHCSAVRVNHVYFCDGTPCVCTLTISTWNETSHRSLRLGLTQRAADWLICSSCVPRPCPHVSISIQISFLLHNSEEAISALICEICAVLNGIALICTKCPTLNADQPKTLPDFGWTSLLSIPETHINQSAVC